MSEGLFGRRSLGELIRYGVASGVNVVATFLVFALLTWLWPSQPQIDLAITWLFAIALNYVMHLNWVFSLTKRPRLDATFLRYLVAYGVTYALNAGFLELMVRAGLPALLGQLIATPLVVISNYLLIRFVVLDRATRARIVAADAKGTGK